MTEMKPLRTHRTNTILYCDQWDASVRFYRDVLNLQVLTEKAWFVEFQLNKCAYLSVAHTARTSVPSAGGAGITLSWQVENMVGLYERLVAEGIDVTPIKESWGVQAFFVADPEGHRIELWS